MEDNRVQGKSYGYVVIPDGGLSVAGVKFPAGPRPAGKGPGGGWYRLLVDAGCPVITQEEYEDELQHSGQPPVPAPTDTDAAGQEEDENDRTGHDRGDLPATRNPKPKRGAVRNRRRTPARAAGARASDDGVPGN